MALEFAKEHKDTWQTFIIKPGGVITPDMYARGLLSMLMGNGGIKSEELDVYVAELVVTGKEEEGLIYNERMLEKGRGLQQTRVERR